MNPDGYKEVFSASDEIGKLGEAPYLYFDKNISLQIATDSPTISIKRMENRSYGPNIADSEYTYRWCVLLYFHNR